MPLVLRFEQPRRAGLGDAGPLPITTGQTQAAGAAIGTAVLPGAGSAIGGAVGMGIGIINQNLGAGAAVGTVIFPGVGTAVGYFLDHVLGLFDTAPPYQDQAQAFAQAFDQKDPLALATLATLIAHVTLNKSDTRGNKLGAPQGAMDAYVKAVADAKTAAAGQTDVNSVDYIRAHAAFTDQMNHALGLMEAAAAAELRRAWPAEDPYWSAVRRWPATIAAKDVQDKIEAQAAAFFAAQAAPAAAPIDLEAFKRSIGVVTLSFDITPPGVAASAGAGAGAAAAKGGIGAIVAGAVAGAFVAGPPGALIGAGVGAFLKK